MTPSEQFAAVERDLLAREAERRRRVLVRLRELQNEKDFESAHQQADLLVLYLLGDEEVFKAWEAVRRCYA